MSKPITDHEDNHFPSVKDMCAHWGIAQSTYHGRIRKGLSQKQALADPGAKDNIEHLHPQPKPAQTIQDKHFHL